MSVKKKTTTLKMKFTGILDILMFTFISDHGGINLHSTKPLNRTFYVGPMNLFITKKKKLVVEPHLEVEALPYQELNFQIGCYCNDIFRHF